LEDKSQTQTDRNNHINRPVRTARAVVQHYNAAIHITMQQYTLQCSNTHYNAQYTLQCTIHITMQQYTLQCSNDNWRHFYSIVLLTDTILLGALVVLWHLHRPNLDVLE